MTLRIELKVTPQSGKQQFTRDASGIIKCFLKSAPEGGKANDELVKLLSKKLTIPQQNIIIAQGITSRKKVVKITASLSMNELLIKLGLEVQNSL